MTKTNGFRVINRAVRICVFALVLSVPTLAKGDLISETKVVSNIAVIASPGTKDVVVSTSMGTPAIMPLATKLALLNQPNLIVQHKRVKFFRDQFAAPSENSHEGIQLDPPIREESAPNNIVLDRQTLHGEPNASVTTNAQQLAIKSLQDKIAARQAPNPLMPFGGLATTLYLLSNGVAKIMINNLSAGHLPVYGDNGEVVGTRHATSGKLTAGRENPEKKGQIWKNQS